MSDELDMSALDEVPTDVLIIAAERMLRQRMTVLSGLDIDDAYDDDPEVLKELEELGNLREGNVHDALTVLGRLRGRIEPGYVPGSDPDAPHLSYQEGAERLERLARERADHSRLRLVRPDGGAE